MSLDSGSLRQRFRDRWADIQYRHQPPVTKRENLIRLDLKALTGRIDSVHYQYCELYVRNPAGQARLTNDSYWACSTRKYVN